METIPSKKVVYMFPGQGAQQSKMGLSVWEAHAKAKEIFALASKIYGENLEDICFHQPFTAMQRTDHAQILIATVSIIFYEILKDAGKFPHVVMGHSAGELSALYASGALGLEDVLKLVTVRGKSMYEAALRNKGKMIAVVGADFNYVLVTLQAEKKEGEVLGISNHNAPQEIVVSGDEEAVVRLSQRIEKEGQARVVDLQQQGAWHSEHMRSAQDRFAATIDTMTLVTPKIPMMFNYSVEYATDPLVIRRNLVELITGSVRWYPCLTKVIEEKADVFCEVGPNKILRGILRKSHPGNYPYEAVSINDLNSLNAFLQK